MFLREIGQKAVKRLILLEEFNCYNGVADIVLAILRPYVRRKKSRQPVNHNWLLPLAQLSENRVVQVKEYAEFFGVSNRTARKHLENFADAGFLACLEKGRYRVNRAYSPVLESTISLEAKLHDWRRGLAQAYRYRRFSNHSFVLLPEAMAGGALNNLDAFRRHDVGLVTLGTNGLSVHHCPTWRERPANEAFLRLNETAYTQFSTVD
jgi:hypothetical protein